MAVARPLSFGCAAILLLLAGACTRVTIHEEDGQVRVVEQAGIAKIEVVQARKNQLVEVESYGIVQTNGNLAIGYHRLDLAVLAPDDCRIVLWIKSKEELVALDGLRASRPDICVIGDNVSN